MTRQCMTRWGHHSSVAQKVKKPAFNSLISTENAEARVDALRSHAKGSASVQFLRDFFYISALNIFICRMVDSPDDNEHEYGGAT
ncbi:hypothetical protein M413DRAFT_396251 [Hebeloma cylindrosporum]|uniref:Uncharacterized protein n=1 Tax=Hebeloma cylindrosporum TaxID=76867 RepID=A0A0C3C2I5_HEBCY|nr:hypothetical protein M413DRAFT_396251 [Hebeloma cylindrosporum h7]